MKLAGEMLVSRTIRRIDSDFRLRRGRARCSTHGRPFAFSRSTPSGTWISSSPVNGVSTAIDGDDARSTECRGADGCTSAPAEAKPKDSMAAIVSWKRVDELARRPGDRLASAVE